MSLYLTMELEHEGPARAIPGDRKSEELFCGNHLPYCFEVVHTIAELSGVTSIFDFSKGREEAQKRAEIAVYGKPETQLEIGDPEITEQTEAEVLRIYYESGPWFEPEDGLRTASALLEYFRANLADLDCPRGGGVVGDLEEFEKALRECQRRGRRFRLHYSY